MEAVLNESYVISSSNGVVGSYSENARVAVEIKLNRLENKDKIMEEAKRLGYNVDNNMCRANLNSADQTDDDIDLLANGFKIRDQNTGSNADGATYLYYAFAEQPLTTPFGTSSNAR